MLQEQLRQTKQRLEQGNVTQTDVSQSEARLAVGRTQLFAAEADYETSKAAFRQVIGLEPGRLLPASPVDRFSPSTLAGRDRRRHRQQPERDGGAVQRRCRADAGEGRRRRALSDRRHRRQVQKNYEVR